MRLVDYARGVRHVFSANRGRTLLTLLGIMIGSGTIVLLAGLLRGGEEALIETNQRANESDLVTVRRDEPPPKQLHRTRRELSDPDAHFLGDSPLLDGATVMSEAQRDARATWNGKKRHVRLVASDPISLSLNRLTVERGRFLDDVDLIDHRRVCVIGHDIWVTLLDSRDSLDGVFITAAGEQWAVVGVLKSKPPLGGGGAESFWRWDGKVIVPRTTYDSIFDSGHSANRLYVRLRGMANLATHIAALERVVKESLLRRHLGVENFKVEGEDGAANQARLILDIIKMLLFGTGLLSLLVGGINIMNIMLVTVTERTREIGVRRAIGASPRTIQIQFLLEASLISLTGGVVGVLGGMGLCWLTSIILTKALGGWNLHIELWSIGLGLGLSLATGILFGLLPARRAAQLDPVEALRYE